MATIEIEYPGHTPNAKLELTELEDHAYRRLLDLLGFEPVVTCAPEDYSANARTVYAIHDEDSEVIAQGTAIGTAIVNAIYRRASDDAEALYELRTRVAAFQSAHRALLDLG